MESSIICPVCTLFLRPGITLRNHLSTHPKQKVIDALVKLAESETQPGDCCSEEVCSTSSNQPYNSLTNSTWNMEGSSQVPTPFQGNHVFIYQQSMSTSQTNSLNPLTQQYIIPAVLNPQMMPYVYQQQQFIMSSGSCIPQMRLMPFEMTNPSTMGISSSPSVCSTKTVMETNESNENENIEEILDSEYHTAEQTKVNENEVQKKEEIKSNSETENLNEKAYDEEQTEEGSVRIDDVQSESRWNTSSSSEELNKACQTPSAPSSSQQYENFTKKGEYYYFNNESENAVNYSSNVQLESIYEQQDPIYTSANILQSTEHLDFVDVDGVQVIIGDFANNSIISRVDSFDNGTEGNVLMSIGENILETSQKVNFSTAPDVEESISRSSEHVNIRTDERMPPRGELSGQESLGGTSDINWNRLHYNEGSSGTSYNLLGEEVWDDGSDADCPQNEEEHEMPSVVDYTPPPLNFKCSQCDEAFSCLQDRKQHVSKKHTDVGNTNNPKLNIIGNQIGKRKVKKLIVKLKSDSEKKYDTVFTNKIKIENSEQQSIPETRVEDVRIEENVNTDSRTVCAVCNAVLPHAKALKEHKMEIHQIPNNFRFKCTTCNNSFPNEYRFTEHLKVHPLECKLCGKLFYKRQNIQLHTKRHLGIKPYKCDMCEKGFVTKQKLQEHRNIHTGNAPIKCNLCDESFRRHSNLVQHRNRHHFKMKKKVKDYVCHCGEYFHSRKKLAWHKETHDPKPKACTKCNEKFIHLASLTRHMRKAHNERYLPTEERSMENVECPICKGVFLKSSLEVHIRTHSGVRPYSCLICNKDFTTRWNLKLHKWTHASRVSKPFKCDLCNGAFVRESDYTSHMNSHKSIKPYTCNYCGAKFIRKYNCQRHVKEHENAKTYNCSVCDKSFHRSYYLKDHMRVHSGVRPFSCHVCGKTSTTKSNHNKHIQIHHAREPVSTEN